jgi:MerR family redox-sensitive transcriptional activator SoxR
MAEAATTGWSIGEVAERARLRPSAIRYYERIGLLPEPERTNGWRRYDESVLDRLALIGVARRAGFALEEIRTLVSAVSDDTPLPERWRRLAKQKLPEVEAQIRRAEEMKLLLERALECNCLRLEDCALLQRPAA